MLHVASFRWVIWLLLLQACGLPSVFGQEPVNLALNKPITGTGPTWPGYPAANLTDGDPATFTHPEAGSDVKGYYFQVDLGREYGLERIVLSGRNDGCCPERLTQYRIEVYGDREGETGDLRWAAEFRMDGSFPPSGGTDTIRGGANPGGIFAGRFVRVINAGDLPYSPQLAEIEVYGAPGPRVVSFEADDDVIGVGQATSLRWRVENATNVVISPIEAPVELVGTRAIQPLVTTQYRLVARGEGGIVERLVTVGVDVALGPPRITEFLADNVGGLADEEGEAADWIELANTNQFRLNVEGYYLTDDPKDPAKWRLPAVRIPARGRLYVFASGKNRRDPAVFLHTNFRLDAGGDYLALVGKDGKTRLQQFPADHPATPLYPKQRFNISYGLDEAGQWGFMRPPTPGETNGPAFVGIVADTSFSVNRGLYDTNIVLEIRTPTPGAEIRYTTDRSDPTPVTGLVYTMPLVISNTTVVKAAAFVPGWAPTDVDTHTYVFPSNIVTATTMRTSITKHAVYGPLMRRALGDLPSVSLATRAVINDTTEVRTSFEWLPEGGGKGVQVDCGVQRYGGAFTDFAKKSFRLYFRSQYGAPKLKYPVFAGADRGMPALEEFDQLELRNGSHDMEMRGFYMSNIFTDDTLLEMGRLNPHGRFVHLYLNNVYWGVYHLRERWGAAMHASYLGGSKTNYESINGNWNVGGWADPGTPYDGDGSVWTRIKGLRGSYRQVKPWLDVPEYVDYMLMWMFGGSEDEYRCVGPTTPGSGMKFYLNDADGWFCGSWYCDAGDRSRRGAPGRQPGDGPGSLLSTLYKEGDPEFRTLLADQIHRALFRDGALTPARLTNRLMDRFNPIRHAFLAESARWGYLTPTVWTNRRDAVLGGWLTRRTAEVLSQWRAGGFYPALDAPTFEPDGGVVASGTPLGFNAGGRGTVYYTLDGSDPRLVGGSVSPVAKSLKLGGSSTVLVPAGSAWRWFTDGVGLGSSAVVEGAPGWSEANWKHPNYSDTAWKAGPAQLGYGEGDEATPIPFGPNASQKWVTAYFRHRFTVVSTNGLVSAELRLKRDDGAIVYLNGREVLRSAMPADEVLATTLASNSPDDGQGFESFAMAPGLLRPGENVIAVEVHQSGPASSDASFDLELGVNFQGNGGGGDPLPIFTQNTVVKSRAYDGKQWSALNVALFQVGAERVGPGDVMVREMNPHPAGLAETEFLELQNVSRRAVNLRGARFTNGIDHVFSPYMDFLMAPGERCVLVKNLFDFQQRYGIEIPVAGIYQGSLANGGEELALVSGTGSSIFRFQFSTKAPWPTGASGTGRTLVMAFPELDPSNPAAWRVSDTMGGNPGGGDSSRFTGDPGIDADGDGESALLEYAMGGDDLNPDVPGRLLPQRSEEGILGVEVPRNVRAEDVELWVESSVDLVVWTRMTRRGLATGNEIGVRERWEVSVLEETPVFMRVAARQIP